METPFYLLNQVLKYLLSNIMLQEAQYLVALEVFVPIVIML